MEKKQIGYKISRQCEELLRRLAYERKCYPAQVLEDTLMQVYPAEAEMVELLGEINEAVIVDVKARYRTLAEQAKVASEEATAMHNLHATIREVRASVNALSGRAGGGR
jgi:hypothetical protein